MKPPETEPAAFIAFAVVDGLLRKLVSRHTITAIDAQELIANIISDLKVSPRSAAQEIVPVLEKMIEEYRKQHR